MTSILVLGFLLGMRHALEADHLAAVASLATRSRSLLHTVSQGAAWGLGHTLTLLLAGGVCLLASVAIPARLARGFEVCVGIMLLGLGAEVLYRARRRHVHLHVHRHEDGTVHLHAHGHAPGEVHGDAAHGAGHRALPHVHPHPVQDAGGFPRRALLVGLVHGLAGSAALLLLTVSTLSSRWLGLAYILLFGLGSILGMAILSAVIAVPLRGTARLLTRAYVAVEVLTGLSTVAIGAWVLAA
jgi:ABC-type nickel/cobalt efflux system permease component RcnA